MERAIWTLNNVCVRGADGPRLDDVTLQIAPGVTAVTGPSGAGKTTLLNLLVGFEKPDAGSIVCGIERNSQLPVYWCPADHGLWPHMTARAHLEAAASRANQNQFDELLREFDLADHALQRPDHLSQGQRARLCVARSLVTGAKAIVMDEPLIHVDEEAAPRYWQLVMRTIRETGASLVFSTHNSAVAKQWSNRVVQLRGGRIIMSLLCILVSLFLAGCNGGSEETIPVESVSQIVLPPDGLKAPRPRDVAQGGSGEMLCIDNAGRVVVVDREGNVQRIFRTPTNENGNPEGVTLLRDGRIAVADTHYYRVLFFDREGNPLSTLGSEGDGPGQFRYPIKIVEDDAGHLYIAEYGGNDRIQKFTSDGKFLMSIGSFGTEQGQFQRPGGLVWHDGKLYIADTVNNRILIYRDSGAYLGVLGEDVELDLPYDLARGKNGHFFIIEYGGCRLTVLDESGQLVGRFDGGEQWKMSSPWGLEVDREGSVWIADTENGRILRLDR